MSNLFIKRVQVGNSGTANQNFVIRQPDTADGTLKFSNGVIGSATDIISINSVGQLSLLGNVGSTSTTTGTLVITGGAGISGNLYVGGTITELSSIAYKENVEPIAGALDAVLQLVGVTYDRKDGTSKNEPGLIAEDVNRIIPNLVSKGKDGKIEGINYSKLSAYLIEAVKTLKEEIDQLKSHK
jgi:hypothetical protein